ncbi:hypothetical protein CC1G_06064 [Coprinopsis cinerea okayama7|uniref:Mak10-domain-containing protein n=1 Tax=Coprinopsis cinerea (strain Okayama-7 / 130 / ATCC MYA-4618 / FGSC 9003) TaxID=240176 RepID=A8PA04_COPC7|nr:hypothetical protein CC1G_06064 [Coprinopsis cinerea okayama7\|eukprot:XP_001839874.1 hypothetical protein CC1G_06064 [Coprinopsis cinerea okayama7\
MDMLVNEEQQSFEAMAATAFPGFGTRFEDVTDVFEDAVSGVWDVECLLAVLLQIGEPRLDTGYIGDTPPMPFNPLEPMLPEEICWILDKALGYEMEWHAGKLLPHTIFTLQYVHCLTDIEPDMMSWKILSDVDHTRPLELVTVVLGSCVQALLKCCDLTWNEMQNNEMIHDTEDWQSDKCEVPVLENLPVKYFESRLEQAATWVEFSDRIPPKWKQPLIARIRLRKTLLELFNLEPTKNRSQYQSLLDDAQTFITDITSQPPPTLSPSSPAYLVFDPYISRRLNTCVPVRVIPTPTHEETWKALGAFLEGLRELSLLVDRPCLATWESVGKLRVWLSDAPRPAYVRSLTQSSFYNGILVLDQHTFSWALDKLFEERIGVSWSTIRDLVTNGGWTRAAPPPLASIDRKMYRLLTSHIKLNWSNLSRMRRKLMKLVVEWHLVYDWCVDLVEGLSDKIPQTHIIRKLPETILTFRLESIREIILTGFQLELYAAYERPFAYWYLSVVEGRLRECYECVLGVLEQDSAPYKDMQFKLQLSKAIQGLAKGSLLATLPSQTPDWDALRPNFFKRYKWAFRPDYDITTSHPVAHPEMEDFMVFCEEVVAMGDKINPRQYVDTARGILEEMVEGKSVSPWVSGEDTWCEATSQFIRGLKDACDRLAELPTSLAAMDSFDLKRLRWDVGRGSGLWFPAIEPEKEE